MNSERSSLSITRCDNESLNAQSMVGLGPSYQGCDSLNVFVVARENAPSAVGREGTTLNVGNGHCWRNAINVSGVALLITLGEVFGLRNTG